MLGEIESKRGIKAIRVPRAEGDDAVHETSRCGPACVSPALRRAHKGLGEINADILTDPGADEIEQHAVAAPEVRHDLAAGQIDKRQQTSHPLDGVGIVLIDVALIVDGLQLFFGVTAGPAYVCHVPRIQY